MKLRITIAGFVFAAAVFGQGAGSPASPDQPQLDENLILNGPRNLPAQDLLNFKGGDRPSPLKEVSIEQKLNSQVPLDAKFRDEYGHDVKIGDYFGKRPVVLALVYYECPMLCTEILNGVVRAAKVMTFKPGEDYDVLVISFDARETPKQAAAKKAVYMKEYGHPETAGAWHFLTGNPDEIKKRYGCGGIPLQVGRLHRAVRACERGLRADATGEAFEIFLRHGLFAEGYAPWVGRGIAGQNRHPGGSDSSVLLPLRSDQRRSIRRLALGILRVAGGATLLMLGGFVFIMLRQRKQAERDRAA